MVYSDSQTRRACYSDGEKTIVLANVYDYEVINDVPKISKCGKLKFHWKETE